MKRTCNRCHGTGFYEAGEDARPDHCTRADCYRAPAAEPPHQWPKLPTFLDYRPDLAAALLHSLDYIAEEYANVGVTEPPQDVAGLIADRHKNYCRHGRSNCGSSACGKCLDEALAALVAMRKEIDALLAQIRANRYMAVERERERAEQAERERDETRVRDYKSYRRSFTMQKERADKAEKEFASFRKDHAALQTELAKALSELAEARKIIDDIDETWPLHGCSLELRARIDAARGKK